MSLAPQRSRMNMDALLSPKSVAVLGASDGDFIKAAIIGNFSAVGFEGPIYPVNPRRTTIAGLDCFASLELVPAVPDLAVIALGAHRVADALRNAGELGVKAAIVFSGGFADANEAGKVAQKELAAIARQYEIALLGPNCQGVVNFNGPSAAYLLPVETGYRPGTLALISQSGSVTDALANNKQGVGWSHIISTGNEAVVTMADILENLIEEDHVEGVCLFIETIRDPDRFFKACRRARELSKPVIALKSGRTETAQAAALAHTGALASPDRLFDAMFKARGVIRVDSMDELLVAASIVQAGRLPASGRIGAVLGSGGLVELMHDAEAGVEFPEFEAATRQALVSCTGPWVRQTNPLDFWPTDDLGVNYPLMLDAVAADPHIDVVVEVTQYSMLPTGVPGMMGGYGDQAASLARRTEKPVVVITPVAGESVDQDTIRQFAGDGVALVSGLDNALHALGRLGSWASKSVVHSDPGRYGALDCSLVGLPEQFSGAGALDWMKHAGFDVATHAVAGSAEEALDAARQLGYPVTMKIADTDILHKTELGGVAVGLGDDQSVLRTARRMLDSCSTLLIQQTVVGPFSELILGLSTDPLLGRFIIVGLGGVWTEILDDAAVRPVGELDTAAAEEMLRELKGYSSIAGARRQQERSIASATDAILRLDAVAQHATALTSVDLNPIMLTPTRAIVVDALIAHQSIGGGLSAG